MTAQHKSFADRVDQFAYSNAVTAFIRTMTVMSLAVLLTALSPYFHQTWLFVAATLIGRNFYLLAIGGEVQSIIFTIMVIFGTATAAALAIMPRKSPKPSTTTEE